MQKAPVNGHRSDRARAQTAQNAETTPIPLPELPSPPTHKLSKRQLRPNPQ